MTAAASILQEVGALVLAAGASRRMGQPKMILPWGETTVIGQVVKTLLASGLTEINVVTGGSHTVVEEALEMFPVKVVYNPDYMNDDMVHSVRLGLISLNNNIQTALVVLGDQPQIQVDTILTLIEAYSTSAQPIIIPSYKQRRGHPWLVARSLWPKLLAMKPPVTMRDFININRDQILYVDVDTPEILMDLDTPDDYQLHRPAEHG